MTCIRCARPDISARGLCGACYQRGRKNGDLPPLPTPVERFWAGVAKSEACWIWTRSCIRGYGQFYLDGRNRKAHRIAYELLVGPVPDGLVLDHLCRVTRCVNPEHLEPVTVAENNRRSSLAKTGCHRGHPYDDANTYIFRGARACRRCRAEAQARWQARR